MLSVQLMEPRQRCGLACLEMILECALKTEIDAHEIYQRAKSYRAINEHNDWWHPGQVRVLASYNLVAWRRNWTAPSQNFMYLADAEGYTAPQLEAIGRQIDDESSLRDISEKFLHSIQQSLWHHRPVIVSVKSGFSKNSENHQIIVAGWDEAARTYDVYDPVHQDGPDKVSESHLLKYANFWAIFIR